MSLSGLRTIIKGSSTHIKDTSIEKFAITKELYSGSLFDDTIQ